MRPVDELTAGQVGFLTAAIKRVADSRIGETITEAPNPTAVPLPGYREAKPMVFAGLYPIEDTEYEALRDALEKLRLNDSAFNFEPETSLALGFGFRCGFLGMLHMEIVQERLEREFNLSLIATAPSVRYRIETVQGETIEIDNPSKLPPVGDIVTTSEPYVRGSIFVPTEFMGAIYKLAQEARGEHKSVEHIGKRVHIRFDFPLAEIIVDFYDRLKSISQGLRVVRLRVPASSGRPTSSSSTSSSTAIRWTRCRSSSTGTRRTSGARSWPRSCKAVIPRQMFEVVIQAAIGSRVIARETVRPMGKNVTAKCYGGDITRKRKLLEQQKEGKKRMKQVGRVEVPQEAFLSVLRS